MHLGPHVAAPHLMSTSAASGAIESLSGAQGKSTTQDCHEEWHPGLIPAGRSSKGLVQGPLTANPLYRLASEHKSPAVFKTSIDNKPCDLQSGGISVEVFDFDERD